MTTFGAIKTPLARPMCRCIQVMSGSRMKLLNVTSDAFTSSCCSDCANACPLALTIDATASKPSHRRAVLRMMSVCESILYSLRFDRNSRIPVQERPIRTW